MRRLGVLGLAIGLVTFGLAGTGEAAAPSASSPLPTIRGECDAGGGGAGGAVCLVYEILHNLMPRPGGPRAV